MQAMWKSLNERNKHVQCVHMNLFADLWGITLQATLYAYGVSLGEQGNWLGCTRRPRGTLVTRPKLPPQSRDRCSNTPVALCFLWLSQTIAATPTSFHENALSQSKDRLWRGGIAEKACLWSLSRYSRSLPNDNKFRTIKFAKFPNFIVMDLVARAIRNAIRANRFARIIRNWNPYFYSASGRFAQITRISDLRESRH